MWLEYTPDLSRLYLGNGRKSCLYLCGVVGVVIRHGDTRIGAEELETAARAVEIGDAGIFLDEVQKLNCNDSDGLSALLGNLAGKGR